MMRHCHARANECCYLQNSIDVNTQQVAADDSIIIYMLPYFSDYDAPLSEAGEYTPKYHLLRDLLSRFNSRLNTKFYWELSMWIQTNLAWSCLWPVYTRRRQFPWHASPALQGSLWTSYHVPAPVLMGCFELHWGSMFYVRLPVAFMCNENNFAFQSRRSINYYYFQSYAAI